MAVQPSPDSALRVVVLGASFSGCLAARALAEYAHVTIVERDVVSGARVQDESLEEARGGGRGG